MKAIEIYRCEINGIPPHILRFAEPPTEQNILDVLTAGVEAGWNGRMLPFGFKDQQDAVATTMVMRQIRAGHYRVFREMLYAREAVEKLPA